MQRSIIGYYCNAKECLVSVGNNTANVKH